jgi:hypothetical protein
MARWLHIAAARGAHLELWQGRCQGPGQCPSANRDGEWLDVATMALTRHFTDWDGLRGFGASTTHLWCQCVSYELAVFSTGRGPVEAVERSGLGPAPGRGARCRARWSRARGDGRRWPKCRSVVLLRGHAPVREPSIGAAVVGKGAPLWVSVRSDPDCHGIRYVQRWLQSRFRTARQCRRSAIRSLCAICSRSASRGARQNTVLGWVGRRRWPSPRCRRPVRRRHGPRLHEIRGA